MRHIRTYENLEERKFFWIVPTDKRLEDALVKLYKKYTRYDTPVKPVSEALGLASWIRNSLRIIGDYVLITLEFTVDEIKDKVTRGPSFNARLYDEQESLKSVGYVYAGTINIPEHELDAIKYNL